MPPLLPTSLIPADDAERLQALAPYLVLGPAPDAVFDEVVRLTAKLFDVPIALVSLVEEGSVWFKANFGLPDGGAGRVDRDQSICSVAILQDATLVFEDLRREPCRLTRPDVAEALDMRFYAGAPLRNAAGYPIGALCVIDRQPRQLSGPEQARLQALAAVVMQLLDPAPGPAPPPRARRPGVAAALRAARPLAHPPRHAGRAGRLRRLARYGRRPAVPGVARGGGRPGHPLAGGPGPRRAGRRAGVRDRQLSSCLK